MNTTRMLPAVPLYAELSPAACFAPRFLSCPPIVTESDEALAFDMRRYFRSTHFPFHGSPEIRRAVEQAVNSNSSKRAMSYQAVPCERRESCTAFTESDFIKALSANDSAQARACFA